MKTLPHRSTISALALAVIVSFSGCAVINSHSETKSYGTLVTNESLAQVQPGNTTADWLIATLGVPASRELVDDQVEVLKYSSRQLTKIKSELLFVLDTSSKREVHRTVFLECTEGVLTRFWVEETETS
ncbi:MAG: hypothetical protein ACN6I3_00080 [bacterium]